MKVEDLKEVKLPAYKIEFSSTNYRIQLLGTASNRGQAKEVYEGTILREMVEHATALAASTAMNQVGTLSVAQVTVCELENQ